MDVSHTNQQVVNGCKREMQRFESMRGNIVNSKMIDFEHPEYSDTHDDYYGHMRTEGESFHKTIQVIVP